MEKLLIWSQLYFTIFLWTKHILMYLNLINRILGQALETEGMPTVAERARIFDLDIIITHFADKDPQGRPEHILDPNGSLFPYSLAICHKLAGELHGQFLAGVRLGLHGFYRLLDMLLVGVKGVGVVGLGQDQA